VDRYHAGPAGPAEKEDATMLYARRERPIITALMLMVLATAALMAGTAAGREVDERLAVEPDGTVTIDNLAGEVTVIGWDKAEVHVTGTLEDIVKKFIFETSGSKTKIKAVYPKHVDGTEGTFLEIRVPQASRLDISTVSAEIEVSGVSGRVDAQSVSGDVTIEDEPAEINAQTVSGTVLLEVVCERVYAQSVSGDVEIEGVRGEVEAETVSGEISVIGGDFTRFDGNSVSGDITFRGALSGDGVFSFNAHSGDVVLELPSNVSAEFEVSTFSGDIDNDFGPDGERTSKYAPGRELEFTAGSGDARVRINTFSGDVELSER
jgi:DUF4097 and DUF4098 domain-containing protein YvlB